MTKPWLTSYDQGVPHSLTYPDSTLADLLIETSARYPHYIATTYNDVDITYQEINEKTNGFAHALLDLGVAKGDCVSLILPNSPTYIIAFYAIIKIGAIAVNINVMSHGKELIKFLNDSASKIVITLDLFVKNVTEIVKETAINNIIIHSVFGLEKEIPQDQNRPDFLILNDLVADQTKREPELGCSVEDIAVLQYTSGATGTPKAAILTHRSIVSNIMQMSSWDPKLTPNNPAIICIIPFFHVFGMTVCLHLSVCNGYRMILFPMFDWSSIIEIVNAIKKYRPVSFPAVPALWAALVSHTDAAQYNLSVIDIACSGGAPLPNWVQDKYHGLTGRNIVQAYGLSEASSTSHLTPFYGNSVSDSIGLPLPDTMVRIVDIDGGDKDCPLGEVGEMIIKGPQLMRGYWKNPELTRQILRNGWLYTGDLARMDKNGYFYLVDRKDDLIITSGFNVYPSEVEKVLMEHANVKDACVVGSPDRLRGESIVAFVVLEENTEVEKNTLISFCRKQLPEYKVPRFVRFKDEIPKNRVGKPLRKILRDE